MTRGTKIFLAFFALIVGFLVVYYGAIMPENTVSPSRASAKDVIPAPGTVSKPPQPVKSVKPVVDSPVIANAPILIAPPAAPEGSLAPDPEEAKRVAESPHPDAPVAHDSSPSDRPTLLPLVQMGKVKQPESKADHPAPGAGTSNHPTGDVKPGAVQPSTTSLATTTSTPKAPPATQPRRVAPPSTTEYTIKSGDTFMTIAKEWFGDQTKWSLIAKANPLIDPTRLQIGQKIRLPSKDVKPETIKEQIVSAGDNSHYLVQSGDTLAKIARELYGDVAKWEEIYNSNKATIGNDPANLKPGMKLTLPQPPKKSG